MKDQIFEDKVEMILRLRVIQLFVKVHFRIDLFLSGEVECLRLNKERQQFQKKTAMMYMNPHGEQRDQLGQNARDIQKVMQTEMEQGC